MDRVLLFSIRFHDGRYHGTGDWPPAPARLFQALVAGAAHGEHLDPGARDALLWLEGCTAPVIAAPVARVGQSFGVYMPNNDLDAKQGDVRRVGEIRSAIKRMRPRLFDASIPLWYAWTFADSEGGLRHADVACRLADGLYQLGRGVDMAWATPEVLDPVHLEERLQNYPGVIHRPSPTGSGMTLDCPAPGSLQSLEHRFNALGVRFQVQSDGKTLFSQAPKPRFSQVGYDCAVERFLFDIRKLEGDFAAWSLAHATELVRALRGAQATEGQPATGVFGRLAAALPDKAALLQRVLIGRGATEADKAQRVRIVPLPSIGYQHADRAIRRVLVEVPPDCPVAARDIAWGFSGLVVDPGTVDVDTGEITGTSNLVAASDQGMLQHYGAAPGFTSQLWHTVTPIALPFEAAKRSRGHQTSTPSADRLAIEASAVQHIHQALRHACVPKPAVSIRVQREPFDAKGLPASAFADGNRFIHARLWHVALRFAEPVAGPLLIGDGRYLGLGLCAPVQADMEGILAYWVISGLEPSENPKTVTNALRRAVMFRVQEKLGRNAVLPPFFTGHEQDGSTLRGGGKAHLAFAFDPHLLRLLIIAPHLLESRQANKHERACLITLAAALAGLSELRAGAAGRLRLQPTAVDVENDPVFKRSRHWLSITPYQPTRHSKKCEPGQAIAEDVRVELKRRGLPAPTSVEVLDIRQGLRGGLDAKIALSFAVAVPGPLLLGRTCHTGGGFCTAVDKPGDNWR